MRCDKLKGLFLKKWGETQYGKDCEKYIVKEAMTKRYMKSAIEAPQPVWEK